MTTRHNVSHADELYRGGVYYNKFHVGELAARRGVKLSHIMQLDLGTPTTAVTTGVVQTLALATDATTGTSISVSLDVPRTLSVQASHTEAISVPITIRGTDVYGDDVVEQISTLTTVATNTAFGKKAFKTITNVVAGSATTTGNISIGFTNTLGLPVRVKRLADIFAPTMDGVVATGTFTVGAVTATATSGDIRGTWQPNTVPNNVRHYVVRVCLDHNGVRNKDDVFGIDQYTG